MAFLVLSRQGAPIMRFPIEQERVLVGRDLDCDLPLDDANISRHHFEISWNGRGYQLTDFSQNGTFLNGERISGTVDLATDQRIDIGPYTVEFREQIPEAAQVTAGQMFQPTLILKYEPKTKAITIEQIVLSITSPHGTTVERTFDRLPITFGAGQQCSVVIADDPYISRQHCQIEGTSAGLQLRDNTSRNGTWWNRQQIATHLLPERGSFQIGKTTIAFHVKVVREALQPASQHRYGEMLGASPAMQDLFALIARVAPSDATILITGESGTGKELLARALHAGSGRSHRPFIALNCGSIPATIIESELFGHERGAFTGATTQHKGVFEQANGGTLFLDEIGEMPLELQTRLLRVLETRTVRRVGGTQDAPVDLRIIAATHRDLPALVAKGLFREDLYYRLFMIPLHIAPLRERPEDISLLAQHFLHRYRPHGSQLEFSGEAKTWLLRHPWPGNIRELKHAIERVVLTTTGPLITQTDLMRTPAIPAGGPTPPQYPQLSTAPNHVRLQERTLIEQALRNASGNIARAAKTLGMARTTLHGRIRALKLDVDTLLTE